MLIDRIYDVYITQGTVKVYRLHKELLPIVLPFNNVNPYLVVIMDNASIHHACELEDLIVNQAGARLLLIPPYSPDLMLAEGVFSQIKSIMKTINTDSYALLPEHY